MYQGVFLIQSSCFPYKFTEIDDDSEYEKSENTVFQYEHVLLASGVGTKQRRALLIVLTHPRSQGGGGVREVRTNPPLNTNKHY